MNKDKIFRAAMIAVKLAEADNVPKEVQVLRVGTFHDPRYGQFDITKQILQKMKENYDANVRKLALAFDFKHDSEDVAAGWFQTVNLRNDGDELWAEVEWTKSGNQKLADKEFRYVSAEFQMNYIDNETLKEYGPCLLGAALTNRPVIKGMDPVTLTEGEAQMDPKDKLIQELQAKVADLEKQLKGDSGGDGGNVEMSKMKSDMAAKEKELADMKAKVDSYAAAEKKNAEDKKLAEKEAKFTKLMSEGKAVKAQKEAYLSGDMEKFFELGEKLHEENDGHGGDENGHEETTAGDKDEAADKVIALAEKKIKEKSSKDMASAISLVLHENPKLKAAYYK